MSTNDPGSSTPLRVQGSVGSSRDPILLADLLLRALIQRPSGNLLLEASGEGHELQFENGDQSRSVARFDGPTGDALVARLMIVAGASFEITSGQITRFKARSGARWAEFLLVTRRNAHGLSMELHRMPSAAAKAGRQEVSPDKYELLERVGSGGMGAVYRARHRVLDRIVALKLLHPRLESDPVLAAQFAIEARAACRVNHPGVVAVLDFGELSDGRAYIVMELVEWPRLDHILKSERLATARAVRITRRLVEVVEVVSRHGIVHRDLKPGNIFLGEDDQVKIGDFGLAWIVDPTRVDDRALEAGAVMGTPAFMSPEQMRGALADVRSDIYALGCILYSMLTGKTPLSKSAAAEETTAALALTGPAAQLDLDGGPFPEPVRRVVARATAHAPEHRYQTPMEMLADLETAERSLSFGDWRRWLPR